MQAALKGAQLTLRLVVKQFCQLLLGVEVPSTWSYAVHGPPQHLAMGCWLCHAYQALPHLVLQCTGAVAMQCASNGDRSQSDWRSSSSASCVLGSQHLPMVCLLQRIVAVAMQNVLDGSQLTVKLVVKQLCQLSLGGPAVGLAFGVVMVIWLRYIYNHDVVEVTMTIVAALGSFFVGNEILGVSGVLAVLSLGFWMVAFGEQHISRQVKNPLNVVWWAFMLDTHSEHHMPGLPALCARHISTTLSHAIAPGREP